MNIKGNKNSVYSIKSYKPQIINSKLFLFNLDLRGNFLFKLESNELNKTILYRLYDKLAFNFYPIDCDIEAKNVNRDGDFPAYNPSSHKFNQEIYSYNDTQIKYVGVVIQPKKNKECLIYGSLFTLEKDNKYYEQGAYLTENLPQSFAFNEENNELVYIYYFIENEEKINIKFNLLNKGDYTVIFYINDIESEAKHEIKESKTIVFQRTQWENICFNPQQICKISFNVKSSKYENSFIEITINPKDESENNYKLIITFSIIGLLVIALVVLFVVKSKRKNKIDLESKMDQLTP